MRPGIVRSRQPGTHQDLDNLAGFSRKGKIEGNFKLTVLDGTVPDKRWETPDLYVKIPGGLFGATYKTSAKDDTIHPVWNEYLATS